MIERNFNLGDMVAPIECGKDHIVGKVVELTTFKPDGKEPRDFKPGLYGSFCCGILWGDSKTAIYSFEKNLESFVE